MTTVTGVRVRPDHRDYSHTRTFGAVDFFTPDFDVDAGLTVYNQNSEGRPYGCTGYTQADVCTDKDKVIYLPGFTYDKTRLMEGNEGKDVGCDIRKSLKSTNVYGLQAQGESEEQAFSHRRGSYYQIERAPDYFDGIRSALARGRSVSMATAWYPVFNYPQSNGVLNRPPDYSKKSTYHNYKACGWKTIDGKVYLKIKSWSGQQWGVNGFAYMSPEIVNKLLDDTYSGAFTLDEYTPNAKLVTIYNTYEVVLSYLYRMLQWLT